MLEPKTVSLIDQIVSIKLVIGGNSIIEVLGKLVSRKDGKLFVENPQALTPQHVPGQQQPEIAMINFMLSGDNKIVEFQEAHVMAVGLTAPAAASEYTRITSPIVTPGKPSIIV